VISQLLNMNRTLPAVPVIGAGDHPFQPIWYEDLGKAIAAAVEPNIDRGVYEVAGDDVTTPNQILGLFEQLTGRSPARIPVPEFLAGVTTRLAGVVGAPFPINESHFQMLIEENVVRHPGQNALTRVFGVEATPLMKGLSALADAQPEQTPDQGVGGMEQKHFWADISQSPYGPEKLMDIFRARCTEFMPIEFDTEPGTPQRIVEGVTLTAALPMRGNVQVRVVESAPRVVTFATLRGHPLAGVVRFTTSERGTGVVRFMVSVFARAANMMDWVAISTVGGGAQNATWRTVVQRMIEASGGKSPGVEEQLGVSRGDEGDAIEDWIIELVTEHRRRTREDATAQGDAPPAQHERRPSGGMR
jgi:hypothetical protein